MSRAADARRRAEGREPRQSMERALRGGAQVICQPGAGDPSWRGPRRAASAGLGEGTPDGRSHGEAGASGLVAIVSGPAQGPSLNLEVKARGRRGPDGRLQVTAIVFDGPRKPSVASLAASWRRRGDDLGALTLPR